ncbi:MAG: D-glycero-beta-D-manno-heptose 1,7-bisphosphate 7-phosphatase [Coxiellaceae bacterium]|nr:D-glycero-beta-D-manno-heptose 1,7-bisphosphate 7-phosphatase [Coxiellaceae bacterium]
MLIIMDRDGVINQDSPDYIKSSKEWQPIPHSLNAITRLNHAGHQVVVATNQSGVGRGYYSLETLKSIHQKMHDELSAVGGHLDGVYFCPHAPDEGCECRKPKPGMLLQIAKDFNADLKRAYFIGDSIRDMQAAQSVGALPILVRTGNGEKTEREHQSDLRHIPIYADLSEVVGAIIEGTVS